MRVQKLNKRRFLGDLCAHGHEYGSSGKSIRYKKYNTCCVCNAISVEARKAEHEEYRNKPKNKKKMNRYQSDYRRDKKKANT
jgi:hypothetical protein